MSNSETGRNGPENGPEAGWNGPENGPEAGRNGPGNDPETGPGNGPEAPDRPEGSATSSRWRRLPEPISVDRMTTAQPSHDLPDPELGRDANQEWMLKYG